MTNYATQENDPAPVPSEQAAFPPLVPVDLKREAASVNQVYKNFVVLDVNNHCLRLAVMQGEFRWHHHPQSDECFLVLEGQLEIDLSGGRTVQFQSGETFAIPAGVVHRTHAQARTVILCFEDRNAYTDVVFAESNTAPEK